MMNSTNKISNKSKEKQKGKYLQNYFSYSDFFADRKNSNLTVNNLNNSNSNINSVNNSTNLISISTSSHLKPAKNKKDEDKFKLIIKNKEERKSKEIIFNELNLVSNNFNNGSTLKNETTNNHIISNNNNQNLASNNFNDIESNLNCNYTRVITKVSKMNANPSFDKCK